MSREVEEQAKVKAKKVSWEETYWRRKNKQYAVSGEHIMTTIYKQEAQKELLVKFFSTRGENTSNLEGVNGLQNIALSIV